MKLTIFGATGPSGRLLVNKALAAGHEVTAFARTPSKLAALSEGRSEKLHVVSGELTDAATIETAITGADVVISLLGPTGKSTGTPIADGMRLIVAAMEKHGVKRLVATATPSAQDASDGSSWSFALAVKAIKAFVGSAYQEIVATADVVRTGRWCAYRCSPTSPHRVPPRRATSATPASGCFRSRATRSRTSCSRRSRTRPGSARRRSSATADLRGAHRRR